jgi:hypothetical protein
VFGESFCLLATSNVSGDSQVQMAKEINHGRGNSYLYDCICGAVFNSAEDLSAWQGDAGLEEFPARSAMTRSEVA